jgi:hypothetical protein
MITNSDLVLVPWVERLLVGSGRSGQHRPTKYSEIAAVVEHTRSSCVFPFSPETMLVKWSKNGTAIMFPTLGL